MKKAGDYLRLMRPINCVMMGTAVIVGAALSNLGKLDQAWTKMVYGFITGFTLTAASMTINDYYDRSIDSINEPTRPIPSGSIKPKDAMVFAIILTIFGFTAAYATNPIYPMPLTIAIIAWTLFVSYTTVGKRSGLPGNLLVSACVAIPFVYGSVAVTNDFKLNVLLFASIAFLSNTGREITKGIVDVEGDKTQNVKTLAVRYSDKTAAICATSFYLLAVILSPWPWFLRLVSFWFIPLVVVTDIGLVISSAMLLRNHSRKNARRVKNIVLMWLLFGLMAYMFGAVD